MIVSDAERVVAAHRAGRGPAAPAPGRRDPGQLLAEELEATSSAVAAAGTAVILLDVAPASIAADGESTAAVTVSVTDQAGVGAAGRPVTIDTDDAGQQVSDVVDHGDGTYTATVTASEQPGTVTVRAGDPPAALLATTPLQQHADGEPPAAAVVVAGATAVGSSGGAPVLTLAAINAAAAGILAAWDRFANDRIDEQAGEVSAMLASDYADLPIDDRDDLIDREVDYERAWADGVRRRLDRDLPEALTIADPDQRDERVMKILDRERRFLDMHDQAVLTRAASAAKNARVVRDSPEGVYWELDEDLDTHTADCLAAEGKIWPPAALDAFNFRPKRHINCGCELRTIAWARRKGLYRRDIVLSVDQAMRLIPQILALQEAVVESETATEVLDLVEAPWDSFRHPRDRRGRWRRRAFRPAEVDHRLWAEGPPPLRFESLRAANSWGQAMSADWYAALADDERAAVVRYKGSGYKRINAILRGHDDREPEAEEMLAIDALDRALLAARMDEPVVVAWRGFSDERLLNRFHLVQPGDTLLDDGGYVSTSLLRGVAHGFAHRSPEPIIAEVYVPEGAHAAYLDVPDLDMAEAELLLPRWTTFRVRWAGERTDGQRHLILDAATELDEPGAAR